MKRFFWLLLVWSALSPALMADVWQADSRVIWPQRSDAPRQSAVVSWSDWLVFGDAVSGVPGVRCVLNEMAAAGIRTVWWRTFGGGHALYSSRVPEVTMGNYAGQGADFSCFDSLREAVDYGHRLGLKVYIWYTPMEEAHGWADNVRSRYADRHPELWDRTLYGNPVRTPSFFFAAYQDYKIALGREMLLDYDADGMVIDFERLGAPNRDNHWGYLPEAVAAFQRESGQKNVPAPDDPAWMRFRAKWTEAVVAPLAETAKKRSRPADFGILFRGGTFLTANYDLAALAARPEIDFFAPAVAGGKGWGSIVEQPEKWRDRSRTALRRPIPLVLYTLGSREPEIRATLQRCRENGIDDLIWFETTYLHFNKLYHIPRSLAGPETATLTSPFFDGRGGDFLWILAAGEWTLRLNDAVVATGQAGVAQQVVLPDAPEKSQLTLQCRLASKSPACGVAIQGKKIRTDRNWRSPDGEVVTVGQPGVPPFLGEK